MFLPLGHWRSRLDWMGAARSTDKWWAVVSAAMNRGVARSAENLLTS